MTIDIINQTRLMITRFSSLFLLATPVLCITCTQEYVEPPPPLFNGLVDARLIPYFQAFEEQAALRGIVVDLAVASITGDISNIQEDDVAGTCSYRSHAPNEVMIDLEYWNKSSTLRREMVVFHELGHCYLGRGHLETAFSNGVCTTLMNSGTSGCFVAYSSTNRDYYLNELFEK